MAHILSPRRCVSLDGDADRVVYFASDGGRLQLYDGDRQILGSPTPYTFSFMPCYQPIRYTFVCSDDRVGNDMVIALFCKGRLVDLHTPCKHKIHPMLVWHCKGSCRKSCSQTRRKGVDHINPLCHVRKIFIYCEMSNGMGHNDIRCMVTGSRCSPPGSSTSCLLIWESLDPSSR